MKRRTLLAACSTCVAGLTGCQSSVDDDRGTPTGGSTGEGPSPSTTTGTNASSDVSVEYVVLPGSVPDALQSVSMMFQIIFVTEADEISACLRDTYEGPYKPTITPIPTPESNACYRSETITRDLTEIESHSSLGPITAPGSFAAGHALVVTDVTVTTADDETAAIRGTGGHRANVVDGRPADQYHVEFDVTAAPEGARYDYTLVSRLVEPAN
ncbi:hypothetical protein [Halorientalis marina]|uniref:hypothetical protein n=1 Tax=Halorientalis marina TaxID=2931976 RepID=UPI001FF4AE2C|nr:hypothetical protein [Halorientalis marina]